MRKPLANIAPRFVAMAHGIGFCVAATADADGRPHTRAMQPVWSWDDTTLIGWASTQTDNPKVDHLRVTPALSLTYWNPQHDTCTADCEVTLVSDDAGRTAAWEHFKTAPE